MQYCEKNDAKSFGHQLFISVSVSGDISKFREDQNEKSDGIKKNQLLRPDPDRHSGRRRVLFTGEKSKLVKKRGGSQKKYHCHCIEKRPGLEWHPILTNPMEYNACLNFSSPFSSPTTPYAMM